MTNRVSILKPNLKCFAALLACAASSFYQPAACAQQVEWSGFQPSTRSSHAMAFDSSRGMAVLFGGFNNATLGETWEWNGNRWSQRQVAGPSPREAHAMVFDSERGVVVLFGGRYTDSGPGMVFGDTWEWNGASWLNRNVTGPSARAYHQMVYDSARHVTVLYGGFVGTTPTTNNETWEWNGQAWTRRMVASPATRYGHAMAYDSDRAITVLFGGFAASGGTIDQTWEWNGASWTQRLVTGAPRRAYHSASYDSDRHVTVIFGGYRTPADPLNDTWEFDGNAWTQRVV